eukprot:6184805-Pleurochrysis_carterae.AAC.2
MLQDAFIRALALAGKRAYMPILRRAELQLEQFVHTYMHRGSHARRQASTIARKKYSLRLCGPAILLQPVPGADTFRSNKLALASSCEYRSTLLED